MEHAGDRLPGGVRTNTNDMKTFKITLLQDVKRWYSMPLDVEVEATDAATAITLAYNQAIDKGLRIKGFIYEQNT